MRRHGSRLWPVCFAGVLFALATLLSLAQVNPSPAAASELELLCRSLRASQSAAGREQLAAFARRHSGSELGARASLALGQYEYDRKRYAEAQRWLAGAEGDPVLRDYVLYWSAQTDRARGAHREALAKLQRMRREFPESVMAEPGLLALGDSALALGKADYVSEVLETYPKTETRPALLLLWARAREKGAGDKKERVAEAQRLYREIYYRFPLTEEAKVAAKKLSAADRKLTDTRQMERAAAFYDARQWREARAEYEKFKPLLKKKPLGPELEQVALRLAVCRFQLGAPPKVLGALTLETPEADAERFYRLSQAYRSKKQEAAMLNAVEQVAARYMRSPWTDEALFGAGNHFWVALDRARAAQYYRRDLEQFPAGPNARMAHWRIAWLAYLERSPQVAALFEDHLRRFPGSPFTANALYWLGRSAEGAGNVPHARSFYLKLLGRFPETYFGFEAGKRMQVLGAGPTNSADVLALIPAAAAPPALDDAIPPAATARWERARALRTIAFDASAELELRAAHAATGSPRLLVEAAQAAFDAGRYPAAVLAARQAYPQLETRRLEEGPEEVWRLAYPLPYEEAIQQAAAHAGVDAPLVAGVIRQESVFQREAVSRAGALGLMQVMPSTGRQLARRQKLRYSKARLFEPEYNLRLGSAHLADLLQRYPTRELALAAYNAGPERAAAWQAEHSYEEIAEFVESIPFAETREYVQIVIRNAEVYRRLYGKKP